VREAVTAKFAAVHARANTAEEASMQAIQGSRLGGGGGRWVRDVREKDVDNANAEGGGGGGQWSWEG